MPTHSVIHQPRLAWDAARTIVAAAASHDHFTSSADLLGTVLGREYRHVMRGTRGRLLWPDRDDAAQVEAALWRVRVADLLRTRPELTMPLSAATVEVARRLDGD